MTPIREKESLQAELSGLEHLLSITPDDPLAKPLLQSRIEEKQSRIRQLEERPPLTPETEIFFGQGPVIGSTGIEARFAGEVLRRFQDMVTNHFSAKFVGGLGKCGRRRGESQSRLFLTALPRGSFGLQLAQPHVSDFVTAGQLTQTMEEITDLVSSAAKDDKSFVDTISNFNSRVLVPLTEFLGVLNNAEADCRIISGTRRASLKKEEVMQAYARVVAAKKDEEIITCRGVFGGVLIQSGRFEFMPSGERLISGWIAEEVTEEQAVEMDKLAGKLCKATMRQTTLSIQTGRQTWTHELLDLKPEEPAVTTTPAVPSQ
ncbi:MAG TPA: hypothetical protein VJA21_16165 [Verrucomicrobiae bacterium]